MRHKVVTNFYFHFNNGTRGSQTVVFEGPIAVEIEILYLLIIIALLKVFETFYLLLN
jgi:hypothetical protein